MNFFYKFFIVLFFSQIFFWNICAEYSENNWEIFFNWEKIEKIDEKSFKILDEKFAIDKNSAFFLWKKIEESEPFSFKIFWWDYSHDFRNIFFENKKIWKFSKTDFEARKIFYLWNFYFINWDDVFLFWEKVLWDGQSFEIILEDWKFSWYTKDKNFVYINSQKIIWANPKYFSSKLKNFTDDKNWKYFWYSVDNKKIFYFWEEIFKNFFYKNNLKNWDYLEILESNSDVKIFKILEKIFYNWEKISDDWKNFKILEKNYFSDSKNLFYKNKKIIKNFEIKKLKFLDFLSFWYLKTDFWIFFKWKKISEDVKNFKVLENFYAKDSKNIFLNWEKILWKDLKNFLNKNKKINYFFDDVSKNDDFFEAINFVKNKNIMTGYFTEKWNIFKKDEKINRAEFIKTLISTKFSEERINLCPVNSIYFLDLPFWIWYEKFVCTAKKENLINWYSNWTFWWSKFINLAEALKILSKTYKLKTSEFKTNLWYLEYFIFAKRNGLLDWLENVKVWDLLSRWEVARLIFNFENIRNK